MPTSKRSRACTKPPRLDIQRLYVKEQHNQMQWDRTQAPTPSTYQFELHVNHQHIGTDVYEVTLTLHVTQTAQGRTVQTVRVAQAGVFRFIGQADESTLAHLLNAYAPSFLYPYARQRVAELSLASGLPPIVLRPLDFESLYRQQQSQQRAQTSPSTQPSAIQVAIDEPVLH